MKNYKKILSGLLAALMVLALIPAATFSAFATETRFGGGSGTKADPYQIGTIQNWMDFAAAVNSGETFEGEYFVQTANIDFVGYRAAQASDPGALNNDGIVGYGRVLITASPASSI